MPTTKPTPWSVRPSRAGGDIDPATVSWPCAWTPLPTQRATAAIAELCEHLTATETRCPGTDLVLRYEVKTRP